MMKQTVEYLTAAFMFVATVSSATAALAFERGGHGGGPDWGRAGEHGSPPGGDRAFRGGGHGSARFGLHRGPRSNTFLPAVPFAGGRQHRPRPH
jgi:hypothetical protein